MSKETFNMQVNELPDSRIAVDINVPSMRCKSSYNNSIKSLGNSIKLPGFRQGKVPKAVIIQQVGIDRIKAVALENLINKAWEEAIKEKLIEPISEGELKEELQSLVDRFNPEEDLTFTLESKVATNH